MHLNFLGSHQFRTPTVFFSFMSTTQTQTVNLMFAILATSDLSSSTAISSSWHSFHPVLEWYWILYDRWQLVITDWFNEGRVLLIVINNALGDSRAFQVMHHCFSNITSERLLFQFRFFLSPQAVNGSFSPGKFSKNHVDLDM